MLKIKSFEFSPIQENTYVVYNEAKQCAIIDPGCYFDEEQDELAAFIKEMELTPLLLLNTHCHLDHIFGNKFVSELYNLKPHIHPNEQRVLEYAPISGLSFNLPFDNYNGDLIFLNEHDTVALGNDSMKVLLVPGHSPGSLAFYSEPDGFVVSGDALFYRSIGRTDLPGGNHDQLLKNIREKLFSLPENTKVYSGHGPATNIGDEKRLNPFLS